MIKINVENKFSTAIADIQKIAWFTIVVLYVLPEHVTDTVAVNIWLAEINSGKNVCTILI